MASFPGALIAVFALGVIVGIQTVSFFPALRGLPNAISLQREVSEKIASANNDDDGIEILLYSPRRPDRPTDIFTDQCNASITLVQTHIWDHRVIYPRISNMYGNGNVTYFKVAKAASKFLTSPGLFDAQVDVLEESMNLITFVREPIARAFSAYGEVDANYNARTPRPPRMVERKEDGQLAVPPLTRFNHVPRTNSTSQMICRFELFLDDVFSRRFLDEETGQPSLRYWWPNHAYPLMLHFLYYRDRVRFVGKVETMARDWERLRTDFPHLPPRTMKYRYIYGDTDRSVPYDDHLLNHLEDLPENNYFIKRWVVEVERRVRSQGDDAGRRILEKLCCQYLPDFVCFGYDLPLPKCHCDEFRVEMAK